MGEIADLMLNGDICESCGEELGGSGDGFPRYCSSCRPRSKGRPNATMTLDGVFSLDRFARERRWLEAAARSSGANPDHAPTYLPKLAKRGFVKLVDDIGDRAYFITDAGRQELKRIALNTPKGQSHA